jgi:hypothetical protein
MAFLGQFPPNLVFLIGILRPVRWTVTDERPWSRLTGESAAASPTRSASKRGKHAPSVATVEKIERALAKAARRRELP